MSTPNVGITNNPVLVTKGDPIRVEVRPNGRKGDPGEGVPAGGATGQVLTKASATDYDTAWADNDPDGVQSVTGDGVDNTDPANPVVSWPNAGDIGAYPDTNPSGYVDASGAANAAPVQSVNAQTGDVVLGAGDVGAEAAWVVTTADTGTLTGANVLWLADTSAARNRTLDTDGQRLQVKDVTGSAGTNNITLTAGAGQTINGNATETIDVNYGWVEYVRNGTNWITIGGQ